MKPIQLEGDGLDVKPVIPYVDLKRWSTRHLNGKMIARSIQLAKVLADAEGEPIQSRHLDKVFKLRKKLEEDFNNVDEIGCYAEEQRWGTQAAIYS